MKNKKLADQFRFNPWGIKTQILNADYPYKNVVGVDLGGTKALVAHIDKSFLDSGASRVSGLTAIETRVSFKIDQYNSLIEIIMEYMEKYNIDPEETCLCVAAAGPVQNNSIKMGNRDWSIHAHVIEKQFHFKKVFLLNDLEAMIYAIENIDDDHIEVLNRGKKNQQGNIAVIAAGTGLGESIGIYTSQKKGWLAVSTEGGRCDFAPSGDLEIELLKFLAKKNNHVSWEDILSGKGLCHLYDFLIEQGFKPNSETVSLMETSSQAEVITARGLANKDTVCRKALELFVSIYACESGNLALKCLPYGGIYIAGGIAPRILPLMKEKLFVQRFIGKGKLKSILETIPVYLVTNADYGVLGAINYVLINLPV